MSSICKDSFDNFGNYYSIRQDKDSKCYWVTIIEARYNIIVLNRSYLHKSSARRVIRQQMQAFKDANKNV